MIFDEDAFLRLQQSIFRVARPFEQLTETYEPETDSYCYRAQDGTIRAIVSARLRKVIEKYVSTPTTSPSDLPPTGSSHVTSPTHPPPPPDQPPSQSSADHP